MLKENPLGRPSKSSHNKKSISKCTKCPYNDQISFRSISSIFVYTRLYLIYLPIKACGGE